MAVITALEMCQQIKDALAKAGLPRTSGLHGAQITGWTKSIGSTGFSCKYLPDDEERRFAGAPPDASLMWHIVVSGRPHLIYREHFGRDGVTLHDPANPELLFAPIRNVFRQLGLDVVGVRLAGWRDFENDDVAYNIYTKELGGLEWPIHTRNGW